MNDFFNRIAISGGVIVLLLLVLFIMPILFIWSVNTLAALGGSSFFIPHTLWSYWVSLIFLVCVRGTANNKGVSK